MAAAQVQRSVSVPVSFSADLTPGTPHSYMPCMGNNDDYAGEAVPPSATSQASRVREAVPPSGSLDNFAFANCYPMPVEHHRPKRHRMKLPKQPLFPFTAAVARPVNKAEIARTPLAQQAMDKEWNRLTSKGVWDEKDVEEWDDV